MFPFVELEILPLIPAEVALEGNKKALASISRS
jgi:hypothetical protein